MVVAYWILFLVAIGLGFALGAISYTSTRGAQLQDLALEVEALKQKSRHLRGG